MIIFEYLKILQPYLAEWFKAIPFDAAFAIYRKEFLKVEYTPLVSSGNFRNTESRKAY